MDFIGGGVIYRDSDKQEGKTIEACFNNYFLDYISLSPYYDLNMCNGADSPLFELMISSSNMLK
jgi:hypothetical protein